MANVNTITPTAGEIVRAQDLPHTGPEALTTEHGGIGGEHHAEPQLFGIDATVWVSLAMLALFAILVARKVPALIVGVLDRQIATIRRRLEEAKQLRAEAEALRDEYLHKLGDVENQTRGIVAHAEDEARAIVAQAEADAAELVRRRARMAGDKIAAAERAAIADVRAQAADAATRAARSLIVERHGETADRALVDRTIAGLGRPN